MFIQTLLSQVLKHDFLTFDSEVRWLHSAIFTTTVAVGLNVSLIAPNALPEHVVRCENNILTKFLLEGFKVLDEVDGAVRA
jgi:hypothetical protein